MFGYNGQIAKVNLTTGEIDIQPLDEAFARAYLGGNGFAARFIHDEVPPETEPFSEANRVVFAVGPLNNTSVWTSGRGHLASISPQTGMFIDSNFGGNVGTMMKKSGFDAILIYGRSTSPVYILVDDGHIFIRDANALWGKSTSETHRMIVEKEGRGVETACIGPAGENGVVFASVMCSGQRISAAGRGGIGAVLGYKNCKALAVRGTRDVRIADEDGLKACLKPLFPGLKERAAALTRVGTPLLVSMINSKGKLGTRNNLKETFDLAEAIDGKVIEQDFIEKKISCFRCPIACGKAVRVTDGKFSGTSVKMPEYETLYAIGSMLDNGDIMSIFNANAMCDEMGMDTISFGVTLAFVMECLEKGLLTESQISTEIRFGNGRPIADIAEQTARKLNKTGELIAMGSDRISRLIGQGSDKYLHTVKGLEMAGHSARGLRAMGLGYATATRGGSHHDARPVYLPSDPDNDPGFEQQPKYCIRTQDNTALGDSLVLCRFAFERLFGLELSDKSSPVVSLIHHVTGWDMDLEELMKIGERIYTLERLINVGRGENRLREKLPYRVTHEPIPDGPSKGWYCPEHQLETLLDTYYSLRGWDRNGIPTREKLLELGLD